jgi:hypothetical protein
VVLTALTVYVLRRLAVEPGLQAPQELDLDPAEPVR